MPQSVFEKLFSEEVGKSFREELQRGFPVAVHFHSFDVSTLLAIHRRNIDAFSQAQQLTLQGFQTMARRQGELFSQAVEETASLVKELMSEGTPEEKAVRQADVVQKGYQTSFSNWRELTDIIDKSGMEAADIIHDRVSASLTELKCVLDKSSATHKRSARKQAA